MRWDRVWGIDSMCDDHSFNVLVVAHHDHDHDSKRFPRV